MTKANASPPPNAPALGVEMAASDASRYVLRLYITSATAHSIRAVSNVRKICEIYLEGRYDLEVIDISTNPSLAVNEQIIAAPTLIKTLPLPPRRFIGDMSRPHRLLVGLDLREAAERISSAGRG